MNNLKSIIRTSLVVNLKNITHNWNYLNNYVKKAEVAASIKSNAYGLGAIEVTKSLIKTGCKSFFVATAQEALEIRNINSHIDIYVLNGTEDFNITKELAKKNIMVVLNNFRDLDLWTKVSENIGAKLPCAIHIDTGMNRLGFSEKDVVKLSKLKIKSLLKINLVMSHLACSEKRKSKMNSYQLSLFESYLDLLNLPKSTKISIANSNGIFLGKKYHYNMVRAGALLYGINKPTSIKDLKNVASLYAKILQIREVNKSMTIGYGANYKVDKKSLIAIIELGYADGLPRSHKSKAYVKGKYVSYVGNISMDLSNIDVTKVKNISINDKIEIFGKNILLEKIANRSDTIEYEIISKIGHRVSKIYT